MDDTKLLIPIMDRLYEEGRERLQEDRYQWVIDNVTRDIANYVVMGMALLGTRLYNGIVITEDYLFNIVEGKVPTSSVNEYTRGIDRLIEDELGRLKAEEQSKPPPAARYRSPPDPAPMPRLPRFSSKQALISHYFPIGLQQLTRNERDEIAGWMKRHGHSDLASNNIIAMLGVWASLPDSSNDKNIILRILRSDNSRAINQLNILINDQLNEELEDPSWTDRRPNSPVWQSNLPITPDIRSLAATHMRRGIDYLDDASLNRLHNFLSEDDATIVLTGIGLALARGGNEDSQFLDYVMNSIRNGRRTILYQVVQPIYQYLLDEVDNPSVIVPPGREVEEIDEYEQSSEQTGEVTIDRDRDQDDETQLDQDYEQSSEQTGEVTVDRDRNDYDYEQTGEVTIDRDRDDYDYEQTDDNSQFTSQEEVDEQTQFTQRDEDDEQTGDNSQFTSQEEVDETQDDEQTQRDETQFTQQEQTDEGIYQIGTRILRDAGLLDEILNRVSRQDADIIISSVGSLNRSVDPPLLGIIMDAVNSGGENLRGTIEWLHEIASASRPPVDLDINVVPDVREIVGFVLNHYYS